jgi:serine/threonine protein kinase
LAKEERAKVPGRGAAAPDRPQWVEWWPRSAAYEVLSLLGAGGMGEVYRARDTTLQRDVALKVLPATFLRDPERMARFQREGAGSIAMSSSYFTWTLT